jgi:predicted phosphohydrolase
VTPVNNLPTIWAISDTHLSFAKPRDQTRFGSKWQNHAARIKAAWQDRVAPHDVVLMPGDLSWAHSPRNVKPDVEWVAELPGRKILARGNHDYWWKKLEQVQRQVFPPGMYAVQGSCLAVDNVVICGTMGHIAPNDPYYQQHKYKSYKRELNWLKRSLESAQQQRTNGEPVLLMMHYPPYTSDGRPSGFTEVIQQYKPDACVYGHLHFEQEWAVAVTDEQAGTCYHLVACDYLDMIPRQIWPPVRSKS